jgi:DNA-binding FadR family transcriptional regulator
MQPIRRSSTHELVLERLRRAIHLGEYLPGDRLPSERELAHRLAVSRVTLREATKQLEAEGYVVTQRGASGGLRVTTLNAPSARKRSEVGVDRTYLEELFAYRRTIECSAAALAARNRTKDDLEAMRASIDALDDNVDVARFRRADTAFHRAVARASRNRFLVQAVEDARDAVFLLISERDYDLILPSTLAGHRAVYGAIGLGDERAAEAAMRDHLSVSYTEVRSVAVLGLRRPPD